MNPRKQESSIDSNNPSKKDFNLGSLQSLFLDLYSMRHISMG
jgi:hypothetical protein